MKTFIRGEIKLGFNNVVCILATFSDGSAVRSYMAGTIHDGKAIYFERAIKIDRHDPTTVQTITPEQIEQIKKDITI